MTRLLPLFPLDAVLLPETSLPFHVFEPRYREMVHDAAASHEIVMQSLSYSPTDRGLRVIAAGLDTDFRGEPFGPVPVLMALAEQVDKLQAICMICGEPATRTQRLVNGKPARYKDPVVIVGAAEMYEARCRKHHEVPR